MSGILLRNVSSLCLKRLCTIVGGSRFSIGCVTHPGSLLYNLVALSIGFAVFQVEFCRPVVSYIALIPRRLPSLSLSGSGSKKVR